MKSSAKTLASRLIIVLIFSFILFSACRKEINPPSEEIRSKQTNTYSSEVAIKWLELQWRIFSQSGRPASENPSRHLAYTGIVLYESVLQGMTLYQTLSGQLTDMPAMPTLQPEVEYHWPSCANAAQAYINKNLLPTTTTENKNSIDSLAKALSTTYKLQVDSVTFQRSVDYGEAIAKLIFEWSKTDRFLELLSVPYVIPVGPGLWKTTVLPSGPAAPSGPYWGDGRLLMPRILTATYPAPPLPYSTDAASPFYNAMKDVHDASLVLTPEQRNQANYWRNAPLPQWLGILTQVLKDEGENVKLDKAALVMAKMGIASNDVRIICWKAKYDYKRLRPFTYVRKVMGYSSWNSLTPTAPQPEYPSGHASWFSSASSVMTQMFGDNYKFIDHTKEPIFSPLGFNSFNEAAVHGSFSRFYLGMNTRSSVQAGIDLGSKIVEYMNTNINFFKIIMGEIEHRGFLFNRSDSF